MRIWGTFIIDRQVLLSSGISRPGLLMRIAWTALPTGTPSILLASDRIWC